MTPPVGGQTKVPSLVLSVSLAGLTPLRPLHLSLDKKTHVIATTTNDNSNNGYWLPG